MCCVAVCGLTDTGLMVRIVALWLPISHVLVQQRHHFDPSRDVGHQYSTDNFVRVSES